MITVVIIFGLLQHQLKTCKDLKNTYTTASCCDTSEKTVLPETYTPAKKTITHPQDYGVFSASKNSNTPYREEASSDTLSTTEYDFIVAGGGTAGVMYAARLAQNDQKVLLIEAGDAYQPTTVKIAYQLVHIMNHNTTCVDGTPGPVNGDTGFPTCVYNRTRLISRNWLPLARKFEQFYHSKGLVKDHIPAGNAFGNADFGTTFQVEDMPNVTYDYAYVVDLLAFTLSPLIWPRKGLVEAPYITMQPVLDLYASDPQKYSNILNHPTITQPLEDYAQTGGTGDNWLYKGPRIGLLIDLTTHPHYNVFSGQSGSEEWFNYDVRWNGFDTGIAKYPRGKQIGGSSVQNAGVFYPLTKEALEVFAKVYDEPEWNSDRVHEIAFVDTVAMNPYCNLSKVREEVEAGLWNGSNPYNNIHGAKYGCSGPASATAIEFLSGDAANDPTTKPYQNMRWQESVYGPEAVGDESIICGDFNETRRLNCRVGLQSLNPWTNRRSSSADVLPMLEREGKLDSDKGVCWFPDKFDDSFTGALNKHAVPEDVNCETSTGRRRALHVLPLAQVAKLVYDEDDPMRVIGVEYLLTREQKVMDANRISQPEGIKKLVNCSDLTANDFFPASINFNASIFSQCVGTTYNRAFVRPAAIQWMDSVGENIVKKSQGLSDGWKRQFGQNGTDNVGRHKGAYNVNPINVLFNPSSGFGDGDLNDKDEFSLPEVVNMRTVYAKKEVALAAGVFGTVATMLRSGIGEEKRLFLGSRAQKTNLPVGYTRDHPELLISGTEKSFDKMIQDQQDPTTKNLLSDSPDNKMSTSYLFKAPIADQCTDPLHPRKCKHEHGQFEIELWPRSCFPDNISRVDDYVCNWHQFHIGSWSHFASDWQSPTHTSNTIAPALVYVVPEAMLNLARNLPNEPPKSFGPTHPQFLGYTNGGAGLEKKARLSPFDKTLRGPIFDANGTMVHPGFGYFMTPTRAALPELVETHKRRYDAGKYKYKPFGRVTGSYHPLGKIFQSVDLQSYDTASLKALYEACKSWLKANPDLEWMTGTVRRRSLLDFAERYISTDDSIEMNDQITGVVVVTAENLDRYFNDTENPIVYGLRQNMSFTDFVKEVVTETVWGHHINGGAVMGKPDEDYSVTDGRGRVYNVKGLRVVDYSLGYETFGNPWVAVAQVASVLAHFTLKDWGIQETHFKNYMPFDALHPYASAPQN